MTGRERADRFVKHYWPNGMEWLVDALAREFDACAKAAREDGRATQGVLVEHGPAQGLDDVQKPLDG
jgi:hypothetical protein